MSWSVAVGLKGPLAGWKGVMTAPFGSVKTTPAVVEEENEDDEERGAEVVIVAASVVVVLIELEDEGEGVAAGRS